MERKELKKLFETWDEQVANQEEMIDFLDKIANPEVGEDCTGYFYLFTKILKDNARQLAATKTKIRIACIEEY